MTMFRFPLLNPRIPALLLCLWPGAGLAQTVPDALADDVRFSVLADFMASADLDLARDNAPLTIFAPTDEAFARLPEGVVDRLGAAGGADDLRDVLSLHVVPGGPFGSQNIPVEMQTLSGDRLAATYTSGALTLRIAPPDGTETLQPVVTARAANEARVVFGDVPGGERGVVHGIDRVLLPPDFSLESAGSGAESAAPTANDSSGQNADGDFVADIAEVDTGDTVALPKAEDNATPSATDTSDAGAAPTDEGGKVVTVTIRGAAEGEGPSGDECRTKAGDIVTLPAPDAPAPAEQTAENEPRAGTDTAPAASQGGSAHGGGATDDRSTASQSGDGGGAAEDGRAIDLTDARVSVTDLLGQPVRAADGTARGTVGDFLVSLSGARVQTLVIEIEDGLFGLGDPETQRVDVRDVSVDPVDGAVVLDKGAVEGAE